jgi:putative Ca2+/H+ antiporter (TMEM165/GDT1 family)
VQEPLGDRGQIAYLAVVTNKKRICIVGPTSGSAIAYQAALGARNSASGKAST